MTDFAANQLQVMHMLAQNFVTCDNWFCDVPDLAAKSLVYARGHFPRHSELRYARRPVAAMPDDDAQIDQVLGNTSDQNWKMYHPPVQPERVHRLLYRIH